MSGLKRSNFCVFLLIFSYFRDHVYKLKPKHKNKNNNIVLRKGTYVNTAVQQWNTTLPHKLLSEI